MNNDIKEKIDDIFWEVKKHPMDSDYLVKKEEMKLLLDYITNLQEEYKKSCETYQQALDETMSEKMDLQKENERLNNVINGMEKFFKYEFDNEVRPLGSYKVSVWTICLDKLKELKDKD